ncbi:hypothetical protein OROMI_020218 [Orobanche minor]
MENLGTNPKTNKKEARCKICKNVYSRGKTSSTSSLIRHIKSCKRKHGMTVQTCLQLVKEGENSDIGSLFNFKYDQRKMGEVIAQYILVDEFPFSHVELYVFNKVLSTASPHC